MDGGAPFTHTMRSPLDDSTTAVNFLETESKEAKERTLKVVSISLVLGSF